MTARRPHAHVRRGIARSAMPFEGLALERQLHIVQFEQALVLLHQRVARFHQDLEKRFPVEVVDGRDDREAADELGDHAELHQILGMTSSNCPIDSSSCFERILAPKPSTPPLKASPIRFPP